VSLIDVAKVATLARLLALWLALVTGSAAVMGLGEFVVDMARPTSTHPLQPPPPPAPPLEPPHMGDGEIMRDLERLFSGAGGAWGPSLSREDKDRILTGYYELKESSMTAKQKAFLEGLSGHELMGSKGLSTLGISE
jgi:hypothetical protein